MRAVLFSGQGAQFPGMMKTEYDISQNVRNVFDTAKKVLGRDIAELCFYGSQEDLNLTHNTQPCVLAVDIAAYEYAKEKGVTADAVAGFSLGEYAALVAAGCISLEDAFDVIQYRADVMQEAVPVGQGSMAAIMKQDLATVKSLCGSVDGYVIPANINCPGQIVVSGEAAAVNALLTKAKELKIRAIKLPVSAPFHCELLHSAAIKLEKKLNSISFTKPIIPVYSNVTGYPYNEDDSFIKRLSLQAESPVLWQKTLENMFSSGYTKYVECGPGKTLSGFVTKTLPEAIIESIE